MSDQPTDRTPEGREWAKELVDTHWPNEIVDTLCDLMDRAKLAESEAQRERDELLRKIWRLSQQDRMIIWVAGELQDFVTEALGIDLDTETVEDRLWPERTLGKQDGC